MDVIVALVTDPRLSIVLAPLVLATYATLLVHEIFDRHLDQL